MRCDDPRGAITVARTLFEDVRKWIIDEWGAVQNPLYMSDVTAVAITIAAMTAVPIHPSTCKALGRTN